jgi:hypothetical protein
MSNVAASDEAATICSRTPDPRSSRGLDAARPSGDGTTLSTSSTINPRCEAPTQRGASRTAMGRQRRQQTRAPGKPSKSPGTPPDARTGWHERCIRVVGTARGTSGAAPLSRDSNTQICGSERSSGRMRGESGTPTSREPARCRGFGHRRTGDGDAARWCRRTGRSRARTWRARSWSSSAA